MLKNNSRAVSLRFKRAYMLHGYSRPQGSWLLPALAEHVLPRSKGSINNAPNVVHNLDYYFC